MISNDQFVFISLLGQAYLSANRHLDQASMAYDGSSAEGVQFVKLSGDPIALKVPPGSKVRDVKLDLAKLLGGGSIRLIDETGKVLEVNDVLQGTLQVQRITIAEGEWSELFEAACNGFDEDKLRAAVRAAWPGDFVRVGEDPKIPLHKPLALKYEDEEWFGWQAETYKILQKAIISSCGQWAAYWMFANSADSEGLQYVRPPYNTVEPTVELVVTDVKRWQKLLLDLEDEFAQLRSRCSSYHLCEHLEMAVASLMCHSPFQITDASWIVGIDMWYSPFRRLLTWYFSSVGLDSDIDILKSISNAMEGFVSFEMPEDTVTIITQQMAEKFHWDFKKVDSTSDWLNIRSTLSGMSSKLTPKSLSELPTCPDMHLAFIEAVDATRDPIRAQRMKRALAVCRKAAKETGPLTLDHLLEWQRYLMNIVGNGMFRKHDAYAKQGRERYPLHFGDGQSAEEHFIKLLEEANSTEPVALRASRAYLDVLFFHPLDDGNSRLARLVFDFILTRANVAMGSVDGIFLFARSARDVVGAQRLVELVDYRLAKPGEWKDLEDPPEITKENCRDERWFSMGAFPPDNRKFLEG